MKTNNVRRDCSVDVGEALKIIYRAQVGKEERENRRSFEISDLGGVISTVGISS